MKWIRSRIEAWKSLSVVARALLTTLAMLTGSALVVSATAFAAVSATRAVFPPPADSISDGSSAAASSDVRSETLASGASASEVDADGDALGAAKTTRQKAGSKPVVPMKRTQARRGEPTE